MKKPEQEFLTLVDFIQIILVYICRGVGLTVGVGLILCLCGLSLHWKEFLP